LAEARTELVVGVTAAVASAVADREPSEASTTVKAPTRPVARLNTENLIYVA
jgi:hypothetical protein